MASTGGEAAKTDLAEPKPASPWSRPIDRLGLVLPEESRSYRLKRLLLGPPLISDRIKDERLGKPTALAVLSSDVMSSSAYATEEILRILVPVGGAAAFGLVTPITLVILAVLAVVTICYRDVVKSYPQARGLLRLPRRVRRASLLYQPPDGVTVEAVPEAFSPLPGPLRLIVADPPPAPESSAEEDERHGVRPRRHRPVRNPGDGHVHDGMGRVRGVEPDVARAAPEGVDVVDAVVLAAIGVVDDTVLLGPRHLFRRPPLPRPGARQDRDEKHRSDERHAPGSDREPARTAKQATHAPAHRLNLPPATAVRDILVA